MSDPTRDLLDRLIHLAESTPELPDWNPEIKGTCTCGHSWLFHHLQEPHRCNECEACPGYTPAAVT